MVVHKIVETRQYLQQDSMCIMSFIYEVMIAASTKAYQRVCTYGVNMPIKWLRTPEGTRRSTLRDIMRMCVESAEGALLGIKTHSKYIMYKNIWVL